MHTVGEPLAGLRIEMPTPDIEWLSTPPFTGSDISIPDVVPPTPPLENGISFDAAVSRHVEEGYGFPNVAEVVQENITSEFLKPASPFAVPEDGPPGAIGHLKLKYPRRNAWQNTRRKALLIGIKYDGVATPLEGAHDDVEDMKRFLVDHYDWREEDILILKDDGESKHQPTRDVMVAEMHELVRDVCAGDELFFHYSGHGGQIPDLDGDELDGLDEVIYSCDNREIVDDELHDILIKPLPSGCRLMAVFDCCSSGTGLGGARTSFGPRSMSIRDEASTDLPVTTSWLPVKQFPVPPIPTTASGQTHSRLISPALPGDRSVLELPHNYSYSPIQGQLSPPDSYRYISTSDYSDPARPCFERKHSEGDVVMWSSCHDSERSYEVVASRDRRMKGAMTHAFIECLNDRKRRTYGELLDALNQTLSLWNCPQRPMMSSSHHINMQHLVFL